MEDFTLSNEEIRTVLEDSENVNIESIEYVDLKGVIKTSRYLKDNFYNLFNNKTFEHFISEKSKKVSEENCMLISMDFYHPKIKVRSSSFDYNRYIQNTFTNVFKRINIGYELEFFIMTGDLDYLKDPICQVFIFIFDSIY